MHVWILDMLFSVNKKQKQKKRVNLIWQKKSENNYCF